MAQAVETDKTLQERALIDIALREDGTQTFQKAFEAEMQDVSWPSGNKSFSMEQLTSGGQERTYDPEETKTFSGTMYIKGIDASEATGIETLFHTLNTENAEAGTTETSSASADVLSSLQRDDCRIVVTAVAEDIASATASSTSGNAAYRCILQNSELVSAETDFEDNVLTVEFEFETTAFTPNGVSNVRKQSVRAGSSDSLPSVPDYNSDFNIEDPTFTDTDDA